MLNTRMKILFVCKHNRFRSKVGEALLKKEIKEKGIKGVEVKSAGVALDIANPRVSENVHKILRENGTDAGDVSRKVSEKDIEWADKIIVVADNVSLEIFPEEKTEKWSISDCDQSDVEGIRERTREIGKRVKKMVKELK